MLTAPAFVTSAEAEDRLLTVKFAVAVWMAVPAEPMLPFTVVRLTLPDVSVTAPVLVSVPEPKASALIVPPEPVETLALTARLEKDRNQTVAVPLTAIAAPTVTAPLPTT